MTDDVLLRAATVVVLLGLLGGLLVLGGTDWPVSPTEGPDPEELADDPEAYVDEEVTLSGEVVDPEEAVIEVEHDEGILEVQLEGVPDEALEEGHDITVGGELDVEETAVVEVHRFATKEPWERQYMFAASILGALLAFCYGLNAWRFDPAELAFEPRETTIIARLADGGGGGG